MHLSTEPQPISTWARQSQRKQGFVRPSDIEELRSSNHVAREQLDVPKCDMRCLGLPCVLAGAEHVHVEKTLVRSAICLGRCWQAPVSIPGDDIVSLSPKGVSNGLEKYLKCGGYNVYRNCLSRRRSIESVLDALSGASFTPKDGCWPLGKSLRGLRAEGTPASFLICLDHVFPGDMSQAFHIEHYTHEMIEGLLIAASAVSPKEVIIHFSLAHRHSAVRIDGELNNLSNLNFTFPFSIRFEGPQPLSPTDLGETAVLIVEPEILCRVPLALSLGRDPLNGMPGDTKTQTLFAVTGCVTAPSVFLAPSNASIKELLDLASGMREGNSFDGFIAGAWHRPALGEEHLNLTIDEAEICNNPCTAYPICFLSKEAPIRRQHGFVSRRGRA